MAPRIPVSLRPKNQGGAVTVAEQRDIKRFGSIEAGKQYRQAQAEFNATRDSQIAELQSKIAAAEKQAGSWRGEITGRKTKNFQRKAEANARAEEAKIAEYQKALQQLEQGGTYQDVNQLVQSVEQYGSQVYSVQKEKLDRAAPGRSRGGRSGDVYVPKGYKELSGGRFYQDGITFDQQGKIIKVEAGVDVEKAVGRQIYDTDISPQSEYYKKPEVVSRPTIAPTSDPNALYYELTDDGPGSTVYTTPTKQGRKITQAEFQQLQKGSGVVGKGSINPGEPQYVPLETLEARGEAEPRIRNVRMQEDMRKIGSFGTATAVSEDKRFRMTQDAPGKTSQYAKLGKQEIYEMQQAEEAGSFSNVAKKGMQAGGAVFNFWGQEVVGGIREEGVPGFGLNVQQPVGSVFTSPVVKTAPLGDPRVQEGIVVAIKETQGAIAKIGPLTNEVKKAVKSYERGVVEPIGEFVQGRGNPITDIANAKRYIDEVAKVSPESTVVIGVGQNKRQVQVSELANKGLLDFMKTVYQKEVETSFTGAGKQIGMTDTQAYIFGKTYGVVGTSAPYLVGGGVGSGLFLTEVGAKAVEAETISGYVGGPRSALQYAVENPVEVGVAGALAYGKGISFLSKKIAKADVAKYAEYLKEPDSVGYSVEQKVKAYGGNSPKVKTLEKLFVRSGKDATAEIKPLLKGQTKFVYYEPTGEYVGKIVEKVLVNGKVKTLTGKVIIKVSESGKVIRTIEYSNGFKKVITTKDGKGLLELYNKGGKKVISGGFKDVDTADDLVKVGKTKVIKQKVDLDDPAKYTYNLKTAKVGGKSVKMLELIDSQGNVVLRVDSGSKIGRKLISTKFQSQTGSKAYGKYEGTVRKYQSKSGTASEAVFEQRQLSDVIVSGERRAKSALQIGGKRINVARRVGTRIEYGVDTGKDISRTVVDNSKRISARLSQPKVAREIESLYGKRIIGVQVREGSKAGNTVSKFVEKEKAATLKSFRKAAKATVAREKAAAKAIAKEAKEIAKAEVKAKPYSELLGKYQNKAVESGKVSNQIFDVETAGPDIIGFKDFSKGSDVVRVASPETYVGAGPQASSFGLKIEPSLGSFVKTSSDASLVGFSSLINIQEPVQKPQENTLFSEDTLVETKTEVAFKTSPQSSTDTYTILRNPQITLQKPVLFEGPRAGGGVGGGTRITFPREQIKFPSMRVPDLDLPENKNQRKKIVAYHGEVLIDKKWTRVTSQPHTRAGALDRTARVVDNTLPAQGRVVPIKKEVKGKKKKINLKLPATKLQKGDGYYRKNKGKFREFQIYKGKKSPTKDKIIEKQRYRADTPGESRGLVFSQFDARARKRSAGLPVRRNKKKPFRL